MKRGTHVLSMFILLILNCSLQAAAEAELAGPLDEGYTLKSYRKSLESFFKDKPTLGTRRLTLRSFDAADSHAFANILTEEVLRFFPGRSSYTEQDAARMIDKKREAAAGGRPTGWVVVHTESGQVIGKAGFIRVDAHNHTLEFQGFLDKDYWRQGYMSEIVETIFRYAFDVLKINRIQTKVFKGNRSSIRLHEKLRMRREGELKQGVYDAEKGIYHDVVLFAMTRAEFSERGVVVCC